MFFEKKKKKKGKRKKINKHTLKYGLKSKLYAVDRKLLYDETAC